MSKYEINEGGFHIDGKPILSRYTCPPLMAFIEKAVPLVNAAEEAKPVGWIESRPCSAGGMFYHPGMEKYMRDRVGQVFTFTPLYAHTPVVTAEQAKTEAAKPTKIGEGEGMTKMDKKSAFEFVTVTVSNGYATARYQIRGLKVAGGDGYDDDVSTWTDDDIRETIGQIIGVEPQYRKQIEVVWD
jgi:hypothetical protein